MGGCTASTSPSNSAKAESRHTAGVSAPTSYRPSRTAACATCYSRTGPLHQPVSCRCVAVTIVRRDTEAALLGWLGDVGF